MALDNFLYYVGALIAVITLWISIRKLTAPWRQKVNQTRVWLDKFMRDWSGEDEEEGRAAVPGVMERLNKLDGELTHNGGSSLKDKVEKTQKSVDEMAKSVGAMDKRLERIEKAIVNNVSNRPPSPLI